MTEEEMIGSFLKCEQSPKDIKALLKEKRELVRLAAKKGPEAALKKALEKRAKKSKALHEAWNRKEGAKSGKDKDKKGHAKKKAEDYGNPWIEDYFGLARIPSGTILGLGDDCSVTLVDDGGYEVASADMIVKGRHFRNDDDPETIARKLVDVNVSDIASMGAKPRRMWVSIAMEEMEFDWISKFHKALSKALEKEGVELMGGDTTKGPLALNATVTGWAPAFPLLRRGAREYDDIWVTGEIGLAAFANADDEFKKKITDEKFAKKCEKRRRDPRPRSEFARKLLFLAHSAIDVSDGFIRSVGHIMEESDKKAIVSLDEVPVPEELKSLPEMEGLILAFNGGDDYELLFTAPPEARSEILKAGEETDTPLSIVGMVLPSDEEAKAEDDDGVERKPGKADKGDKSAKAAKQGKAEKTEKADKRGKKDSKDSEDVKEAGEAEVGKEAESSERRKADGHKESEAAGKEAHKQQKEEEGKARGAAKKQSGGSKEEADQHGKAEDKPEEEQGAQPEKDKRTGAPHWRERIILVDKDSKPVEVEMRGYDHFSED